MRFHSQSLLLALLLVGCGRATTPSDVKMVGVGYHPDEIGPAPTPYGGVLEYNLFEFAGAGLSLGFASLLSFEEVGSDLGFQPPYSLVYGFGYIFDVKLDGAVSVGTVQPAPVAEDSCYTIAEGVGPIGSFTTTDVGTAVTFSSTESDAAFSIERNPTDYPPDPQDMFIYYSSISGYRPEAATGYVPGATSDPLDMETRVLRSANFPFGETVAMSFPGGVAQEHAPVGSLPLPSSYVGDAEVVLPHRHDGVRLSWAGPLYNNKGQLLASEGEQATCLSYHWPDELAIPETAQGCADAELEYSGESGQIYTGPWDTEEGKVKFEWTVPEDGDDEVVTLSVRLLGEVDRDDFEYFGRYMVNGDWDASSGTWKEGTDPRCGRNAQSCEEGEWVFDPSYYDVDYYDPEDGSCNDADHPLDDEAPLIPALQGDPMHTVAEVTCRLQDDGEFELSEDLLARAHGYAAQYGAYGAIFLLTRTSSVEAEVPDVKDAYDHRRPITPVQVNARTVTFGRFWYGENTGTIEGEE